METREDTRNHTREQLEERLLMTEKLVSLGVLAAGIVHEIRNPLNFVVNFSETSQELIGELRNLLEPHLKHLEAGDLQSIQDLFDDLASDVETIGRHGKRAESIVRNMLAYSRDSASEPVATDLNALLSEALDLAYHSERASDHGFRINLETHFSSRSESIWAIPPDLLRVFINLFSNAFYATRKKLKGEPPPEDYEPTVVVATTDVREGVEIRIRDNGTGIPHSELSRLFTPFHTTKPTGQGTGLGLSICRDIIEKQHAGRIEVQSNEGEFTEFVIWLPEKP